MAPLVVDGRYLLNKYDITSNKRVAAKSTPLFNEFTNDDLLVLYFHVKFNIYEGIL